MIAIQQPRRNPGRRRVAHAVRAGRGFTLVELLTVLFIISLLVGILIPSLTAARNAAKKASTKSMFRALEVGLESFKNAHESEFRATNGYPPSYAHPRIDNTFDSLLGQFPFLKSRPVIYGAHWLPAMLLGVDGNGYAPRAKVPRNLQNKPEEWYKSANSQYNVERAPLYLDPSGVRLVRTQDLPGRPPENLPLFFPDWKKEGADGEPLMSELPVIVDAFEQPILYYASNAGGSPRNMAEPARTANNNYGPKGPPYYFHQDNWGFTGKEKGSGPSAGTHIGWRFGKYGHAIAHSGGDATPANIATFGAGPDIERDDPVTGETFANFIRDRQAHASILRLPESQQEDAPLKPVNPETYLLISAGVDGRYGTIDDVTNFPRE